jgi:hypothetical protein
MYKPINRTTVQTEENKYRLYSKAGPLFYKKPDGTFDDIDLTFRDTTSSIGDISLMNKGVVSVGKRKGNNPTKIVGIRPDNTQNGDKQLEFSLNSVKINGESQEFNVETDLSIALKLSKVLQLVKLNKEFSQCEIEFTLDLKGMDFVNEKHTNTSKIQEYGFNLTNIGENIGSDTLGMYNGYNSLNKDIPYLDFYIGKITDEYIATGEYTNNEEFGDDDLSDYTLEQMYLGGSSIYFKDCVILACKPYNIENYENSIVNNLCDIYNLEIFNDGGSGVYFTKDNKKVGGYYSNEKTFFAFFNTCDIPDKIKTLFQRKNFEETSFLNITASELESEINNRFNKNLDIDVDNNYFKENNNGTFEIKVSKESFFIKKPIAFDENFVPKNYITKHTLKDNGNNSYTYTKYIGVNNSLDINNAKYFDTALYVNHAEDIGITKSGSSSEGTVINGRTDFLGTAVITDADFNTDRGLPLSIPTGVDAMQTICGRNYQVSQTTSQGGGTVTTYRARDIQSIYHFDSSGISGATAVSWNQMGGYMHTDDILTGSEQHDHIDIIALKSDISTTTNSSAYWNQFVGWSAIPAWTSSDTTPYSSNATIDASYTYNGYVANPSGSSTTHTINFNSTALTDLNDNDTYKFLLMEYDRFYLGDLTAFGGYDGWGVYMGSQIDNTTSAYRPYLEVTTGGVSTPTDNATFFGTNF